MIKFLKLKNGSLLNVNEVRAFTKNVYFDKQYKVSGEVSRKAVAEIIASTRYGIQAVVRATAAAPSTEDEEWETGAERCESADRKISEIVDTMVVLLIDKMNDEHEKIIGIDTRFLEDAMQAEVDRG